MTTKPALLLVSANKTPRFEDYKVPLYTKELHNPGWITHIRGDEWRDELNKLVSPPEINFAGKYFICAHSCGTGCSYYTLTDLSSGRELEVLDKLKTMGPRQKTRNKDKYFIELMSRPNSKMLVVQYQSELNQRKPECWERVYLFEGERLQPITNIRRRCRKL